MPPRDPIDPEIFVALGGHTEELTIQHDGVTLEHLTYYSEDLLEITSHPEHRTGKRYKVTVDTSDLYNAFIVNPYRRDRIIRLRPNGRCAKYAQGRRLFQHRKTIEYHNKLNKKQATTIEDLEVAGRTYPKELAELFDKRKLQRNAQALAKFHSQVTKKLKRSAIVNAVASAAGSADHLDFAAPLSPKSLRSKSPNNPGRDRDGTPEKLVIQKADGELIEHDPLESAVEEHKRRGSPRNEKSGPVVEAQRTAEELAAFDPATKLDGSIDPALRRAALKARLKNKDVDE